MRKYEINNNFNLIKSNRNLNILKLFPFISLISVINQIKKFTEAVERGRMINEEKKRSSSEHR